VVNQGYRFNFIENGVLKAPYTDKRLAKNSGLPTPEALKHLMMVSPL
jgi:predicted Zn-dependent protease